MNSWRHHYIPEFYLDGFTNEDGKFIVYDIEKSKYLKNGKEFSPRSIFFEPDANSFIKEQEKDDFLERRHYSKIDNDTAKIFQRIRYAKPDTGFGVSDDDMPALQFFLAVMYWRNPNHYDQIKHLIGSRELHELGIIIMDQDNNTVRHSEIEAQLKSDPNFFKAMKYWLPMATYLRILENRTPLTIQSFPKGLPSICSDNPIIFENSHSPDLYMDDFIFPLCNDLVFVRGNGINKILTTIKVEIDLIILLQAKKYVTCTDKRYIPMLIKAFQNNYNSLDALKESVFKRLIKN